MYSEDVEFRRTLFSGSLLDLAGDTDTDQSVVWLELLQGLWGIVDEGKASGLAATELGLEAEDVDLLLGALVELSKLAAEVILGDVGAVWVQNVTVIRNVSPPFSFSSSCLSICRSLCHIFDARAVVLRRRSLSNPLEVLYLDGLT
jgi:hypothetical protein